MTWKDLWLELLLKLRLRGEAPRRRPIPRHDVTELITNATIVKGRTEREFETRLRQRSTITSDLRTDDRLFEPYVDLLAQATIGRDNYSLVKEVGTYILDLTRQFEREHVLTINKSHLYFGLSLNCIYQSDTINSTIYWELSQQEESRTLAAAYDPTIAINRTVSQFTSVINPVELTLRSNHFYDPLRANHVFLSTFSSTLAGQPPPEVFAFFSSGLRYRQIDYWLRNDFTAMTKMYGQELINSLCILCEANLKNNPAVTHTMIGRIINHDLIVVNPGVAAIIGKSHPLPATGLFVTYPSNTEAEFNASFPALLATISTVAHSDNSLKAHLLYGLYMLRNKSLHDFNPGLIYYNNSGLFQGAIGLLFAAVPAIRSL